MSAIKLSMPTLLPLIWKAYMAKELQAQLPSDKPDDTCSYDGPCAIGVGIPLTQRARLDRHDTPEITFLIREGVISIPNSEPISEYDKLQTAHDNWNYRRNQGEQSAKASEAQFVTYLTTLSEKYEVEIPDDVVQGSGG